MVFCPFAEEKSASFFNTTTTIVKNFPFFIKIAPITLVKTVAIFGDFGYNLSLCMQLHKEYYTMFNKNFKKSLIILVACL
ncbi:MAG: hypothetical protein IJD47_03760, partial [Clostridia bacterium]|nr:hypothetical protein [Clostridia bacterium]